MIDAAALYHPAWHEGNARNYPHARAALDALFDLFGVPMAMLDVGCGAHGNLVVHARERRIDAWGFDIGVPEGAPPYLIRRDLSRGFEAPRRFGLVLCMEVAEHLPPESADPLVASLVRATGRRLVFTAAVPGQGGDLHINEQPHAFWREKFQRDGLVYDADSSEKVRERWREVCGPCWWYPQNVQVFEAAA